MARPQNTTKAQADSTDWIAELVAELPLLATTSEAAAALRTTTRNLRRLIIAGRIASVRAKDTGASRVFVPRASIAAYLRGIVQS